MRVVGGTEKLSDAPVVLNTAIAVAMELATGAVQVGFSAFAVGPWLRKAKPRPELSMAAIWSVMVNVLLIANGPISLWLAKAVTTNEKGWVGVTVPGWIVAPIILKLPFWSPVNGDAGVP